MAERLTSVSSTPDTSTDEPSPEEELAQFIPSNSRASCLPEKKGDYEVGAQIGIQCDGPPRVHRLRRVVRLPPGRHGCLQTVRGTARHRRVHGQRLGNEGDLVQGQPAEHHRWPGLLHGHGWLQLGDLDRRRGTEGRLSGQRRDRCPGFAVDQRVASAGRVAREPGRAGATRTHRSRRRPEGHRRRRSAVRDGRDEACNLVLDDTQVSRRHAYLLEVDGNVEVGDLGSSNGTFVNGRRLEQPVTLTPGDSLRIGGTKLRLDGQSETPPRRDC